MKQSKKSLSLYDTDLLKELQEANTRKERPVGFGISIQEYVQAHGVSEVTAHRHFNKMLKERGWKITKFFVGDRQINILHK